MREEDSSAIATSGQTARLSSRPLPQSRPDSTDFRMMELEIENLRLQRLVAELLLKNQQLRKDQE